jgi:hypothetical protein
MGRLEALESGTTTREWSGITQSLSENVAAAILAASEGGILPPVPRPNTRLEAALTGRLGSLSPHF